MATNYYVDPNKADDSGDGLSWETAKKHLYAVIALLTSPITEDIFIYLKATSTPFEGDTSIFGLYCVGNARIYIQAEDFDNEDYEAGTFDLDGARSVTLKHLIAVEACNFVELRGLGFLGESGVAFAGVLVLSGAKVKGKFCRFDDVNAKAVSAGGQLDLENNYYLENMVAVVSAGQGRVNLLGDNLIEDPLRYGIYAVGRSPLPGSNTICPATSAYKRFFADRNQWVRQGPFPGLAAPGDKPLHGVYHDVGFTFLGQKCFRCDPQTIPPQERHDHFSTSFLDGFQVGSGGFLNRAKRQALAADLYRSGDGSRAGLLATEAMTEIFVDLFDWYGLVTSWGPLKARTYARPDLAEPNPDYDLPEYSFGGMAKWVITGNCEEIPLFQYVYNPVMPVRAQYANLSGGTGPGHLEPSHDIGAIFYWIVSKAYLSGMIVSLGYDSVLMDVLSPTFANLDLTVPTYMAGWNRFTPDPEETPDVLQDDHNNPCAGKHPDTSDPNRTYGKPDKERFLRMAAFLRSYVIPEFLVFGEMARPGTLKHNPTLPYDYECFWAVGQFDAVDSLNHDVNARADQMEHKGTFQAKALISAPWRAKSATTPPLSPAALPAVYIVANPSDVRQISELILNTADIFLNRSAAFWRMKMNPGEEESWNRWDAGPYVLLPGTHSFEVDLQPHEILVVKLEASVPNDGRQGGPR